LIVDVDKNAVDYLKNFPVAIEFFAHFLESPMLEDNSDSASASGVSLTDSLTSQTSQQLAPEKRRKRYHLSQPKSLPVLRD